MTWRSQLLGLLNRGTGRLSTTGQGKQITGRLLGARVRVGNGMRYDGLDDDGEVIDDEEVDEDDKADDVVADEAYDEDDEVDEDEAEEEGDDEEEEADDDGKLDATCSGH